MGVASLLDIDEAQEVLDSGLLGMAGVQAPGVGCFSDVPLTNQQADN